MLYFSCASVTFGVSFFHFKCTVFVKSIKATLPREHPCLSVKRASCLVVSDIDTEAVAYYY